LEFLGGGRLARNQDPECPGQELNSFHGGESIGFEVKLRERENFGMETGNRPGHWPSRFP
jgi:hypothetical protein